VSNWIFSHVKVIMLLHRIHFVSWLLQGVGRILSIIHLWIIAECICNHISFNIVLHLQIMEHHKDRLLLIMIWSEVYLLMVKEVRRTRNKKTSICSRVDVPQAYLTLKRVGCSRRASKNNRATVEVVPVRSANTRQVWKPK